MSKRWRVNEGTQVDVGGKMRVGGDEFTASDDELDEHGSRAYVTEVRQQSAPKSDNKAQAAPKPHAAKPDAK
jgi:hypothetical protein